MKSIVSLNWQANKDSVAIAETMGKIVSEFGNSRILYRCLGSDPGLNKVYPYDLTKYVASKLLYIRLSSLLQNECKDLYCVPADNDPFRIFTSASVTLPPFVRGIHSVNFLMELTRRFFFSINLIFFPLVYLYKKKPPFSFVSSFGTHKFKVAVPVMHGLKSSETHSIGGVKRSDDDSYIFCDSVTPQDTLFLFKHWRYSDQREKEMSKVILSRNSMVVNADSFPITLKWILAVLRIHTSIVLSSFYFRQFFTPSLILQIHFYILYWYLHKLREIFNTQYSLEIIRNDYSPSHIIDTLVCNRYNRRTLGIQHGSTCGPYVLPCLCFVHVNRYCIFSEAHRRLHAPYWDSLALEKVGRMNIDWVIETNRRRHEIKQNIVSLYGSTTYIVLINMPSRNPYNLAEKWDEMHAALTRLKSDRFPAHIFLRFRSAEDIGEFASLTGPGSNIIIDHINFTTYELMAACDLFISGGHSSSITEAVAIDKKAFCFDYLGTPEFCFSQYGKDVVLNCQKDVLHAFQALHTGFQNIDCNWALFKKEYTYYTDGTCLSNFHSLFSSVDIFGTSGF